MIGTESLSVSLGVTTLAAVLWWWDRWTPAGIATIRIVGSLWALLRDANAVMAGVLGIVVLVVAALRRSRRAPFIVIGAVALSVSVAAIVSSNIGARWQQPMQNVVTLRQLASPERASFLLDHGLPLSRGAAQDLAGHCANPIGVPVQEGDGSRLLPMDRQPVARCTCDRGSLSRDDGLGAGGTGEMIGIRLPVAEATGTRLHAGSAGDRHRGLPRGPMVLLAWIAVPPGRGGARLEAPVPLVWVARCSSRSPTSTSGWCGTATPRTARHGLAASLELTLGLWLLSIGLLDALLSSARPAAP